MSTRWLLLVFVFAWLVGLVACAPLRVAIGPLDHASIGLDAAAVTGTMWRGQLQDVRLRGIALGDVQVGLSPLPLLWGERRLAIAAPSLRAAIVQGRHHGVEAARARLPLRRLGPLPLAGAMLETNAVTVLFDANGCQRAEGHTSLYLPAFVGTSPLQLAGRWRCAGREAALDLQPSPDASGAVSGLRAELRLGASGRYRVQANVPAADPATRAMLESAGFQPGPGGLSATWEGALFAANATASTAAAGQ